MFEVITDWETAAGGGQQSVTYCATDGSIQDYRIALDNLFTALKGQLAVTTKWKVRGVGRILDAQTGTLTGEWNAGDLAQKVGNGAGTQASDTTQALIRWKTALILDGRRIQGRTFVPGIAVNAISLGNFNSPNVTTWNAALAAFIPAADGAIVWHRPKNGSGGAEAIVSSANVWSELAVLRRRRR